MLWVFLDITYQHINIPKEAKKFHTHSCATHSMLPLNTRPWVWVHCSGSCFWILNCHKRQSDTLQKTEIYGGLPLRCQAVICCGHYGFKLKEMKFRTFTMGGEAREQIAQRYCECPITGSIQGQVEWGFE